MKALQFTEYGGPEVLTWGDAPVPHAGPGQVRVAVRAASVNPADWKMLAGVMSGGQPLAGTGYLGYDAAGVVDEVGERAAGVSAGDEVVGRGQNTQAEYAVLDAWAAKPPAIDWAVAAGAGSVLVAAGADFCFIISLNVAISCAKRSIFSPWALISAFRLSSSTV